MSKTLSLAKNTSGAAAPSPHATFETTNGGAVAAEPLMQPVVKPFTADQLRAMLAELEPTPARAVTDPTMDLSIDLLPPHEVVDTSHMPPPDQRAAAPVSPPAGVHGVFGIGGIALIAPGVVPSNVDPSTGKIYTQPGTRAPTQIQAPPQQFGRRRP